MNTGTWIELVTLIAGAGGGTVAAVAKLTRIAVAVEQLVESMARVAGQVNDHEQRLTKGGL